MLQSRGGGWSGQFCAVTSRKGSAVWLHGRISHRTRVTSYPRGPREVYRGGVESRSHVASPLISVADMRGSGLAVLLLCLLPGLAQETPPGMDTDSGTESPAAPTVSPFVTSVDLRNSSSNMSNFSSVAPSEGENETIAVTDPPTAEASLVVTVTESGTGTPDLTEASQQPATDGGGNSTSPTAVIPKIPASDPGLNLTPPPPTISVTEDVTTGPLSTLTESPPPPRTFLPPDSQTRLTSTAPADTTTTNLTSWTSAIATTTSVTTVLPSYPARPHTTGAQVRREPPLLEVNRNKEMPSFHTASSSNPIFVMIVSVFTIVVVMVVVVVGFRRYKKRTRRTEFRRLQDLPMDDMMEDTPLSLYSY